MNDWIVRSGSTEGDGWAVRIDPGRPGWEYTGLWVADLAPGESRRVEAADREWIVLPLAGGAEVEVDGRTYALAGRPDPFSSATDLLYVPRDSTFTVTSTTGGRIALPSAVARQRLDVVKVESSDVPDELRGAGTASRQVRNFGTPAALAGADSIIACEVLTPAGNWSSYPPHKHDADRPGVETALEEIYYFELRGDAAAPTASAPIGYQRVYGTSDRPIEVLAEVRSGDAVLVPHGWHGPAMAPPGYDMYYLNVMAGPGEVRAWLICDDPAHAWVRGTWADQAVDARLPFH